MHEKELGRYRVEERVLCSVHGYLHNDLCVHAYMSSVTYKSFLLVSFCDPHTYFFFFAPKNYIIKL